MHHSGWLLITCWPPVLVPGVDSRWSSTLPMPGVYSIPLSLREPCEELPLSAPAHPESLGAEQSVTWSFSPLGRDPAMTPGIHTMPPWLGVPWTGRHSSVCNKSREWELVSGPHTPHTQESRSQWSPIDTPPPVPSSASPAGWCLQQYPGSIMCWTRDETVLVLYNGHTAWWRCCCHPHCTDDTDTSAALVPSLCLNSSLRNVGPIPGPCTWHSACALSCWLLASARGTLWLAWFGAKVHTLAPTC